MKFIYWIIIIIVFTGIVGATPFCIFIQRKVKYKRVFNRLKEKFNRLNESNISNKINKIKTISENNKEYVKTYNQINDKYKKMIDNYTLEMDGKITAIDTLFANNDYKVIKEELGKLELSVNNYEKEINNLEKEIKEITNFEEELRKTVVPLKEDFRQLKASFYEHKDELSVCSKIFEKKINELEKTVIILESKLENGYYKESERLIKELDTEVKFYNGHLENMPKLVSFSLQVLPKRKEQALSKYQKMKDEGYPLFNIKVSIIDEKIKTALEEIRVRFEQFNYDGVNESIKEVAYEIESLNEVLDKEVTAKDYFNQYIDVVYSTIDDIGKRFLKAKRDTSNIKGVYYISEEKYSNLSNLENQIHILNRIKMELDAYIHSATKQPFSVLNSKMGELAEYGAEVDGKLLEYQNYILSLKKDVEYCYEKANNYSIAITNRYSTLIGLNHKVLSNVYKEEYTNISDKIEELEKKMKTKPIVVSEINDKCFNLVNQAEALINDMDNNLKMYNMALNIIIFTNKYRSSFSTVNEVLNRAQVHFDNGEFEFAIDGVSEVLQEVHPKAYEEMMKRKGLKDE